MIVWLPLLIVKDCWTCGAAFQLASPAWLALIVQVPTATKVTVVPDTVQTPVVAELKMTVRPEEAVALTVIGPSSKRLPASPPKVIVWLPLAIVSVCCACVSDPLEAVMTGEPAFVSLYLKLALDEPSGICTDVIVVVSPVSRKTPAPELLASPTVIAPVMAGLLAESCRWIVIVPVSCVTCTLCGPVVKTSLVAAPEARFTFVVPLVDVHDRQ